MTQQLANWVKSNKAITVHRLVSSGALSGNLGLTGWQLLDRLSLDVICDFAYGLLIENVSPEDKVKIDKVLEIDRETPSVDASRKVKKTLSDGRVVEMSQARLARLRANYRGIQKMPMKGDGVK